MRGSYLSGPSHLTSLRSSRSPAAQDRSRRRQGEGSVERSGALGGVGTETWTGTLEVPGLDLRRHAADAEWRDREDGSGAEEGAKSARVTFKVTATDDVDGAVPVSCQPRSGSRFKLGRTTVRCEATDSTANTATAAFTVTVKPRR